MGGFDDLIANTLIASPQSAFISTSRLESVAFMFAAHGLQDGYSSYIYYISDNGLGIDVNNYFNIHGANNPSYWTKYIAKKGFTSANAYFKVYGHGNPYSSQAEIAFKHFIPLQNIKGYRIVRYIRIGDDKVPAFISNFIPMSLHIK